MPEITDNFIHIPVRSADLFVENSFRTIDISKPQMIKAVIGRLKSEPNGGTRVQKFIFGKEKWDMESATAWVREHKSMPDYEMGENLQIDFSGRDENMEKVKKTYAFESKDFNDSEKSFIATASTEDIDRDGDVLSTSGWRLKNFKRNPVVLWQHDANLMPIAKAENVWIEENKLKFKPVFAPTDVNPFAEQVYNAYKKGFLTSFSVRFDPVEWEDMPAKEDMPMMRVGRKYKAHELLEISAVNIPANPQATKSAELIDFVVKSYLYENKSNIDLDLKELYAKSDEKLKEKINQLLNLKEMQKKNLETKKLIEIEKFVDEEIEKLSKEIDNESNRAKQKALEIELRELQIGITNLMK